MPEKSARGKRFRRGLLTWDIRAALVTLRLQPDFRTQHDVFDGFKPPFRPCKFGRQDGEATRNDDNGGARQYDHGYAKGENQGAGNANKKSFAEFYVHFVRENDLDAL
jgi:hypothetical protein